MNADRAFAALIDGRITETRPARGELSPARVVAQLGSTTYLFQLLSDGKWRWTATSTYGNDSHVFGFAGCDASGYVVPAAWAELLTRLIDNA